MGEYRISYSYMHLSEPHWFHDPIPSTTDIFLPGLDNYLSLQKQPCIPRLTSHRVQHHPIAIPEALGPPQHAALPWTATCRASWTWFLWKQMIWSGSCCWRILNHQAVFFPQRQWRCAGFPSEWNSCLGIWYWSTVIIELNRRMVGKVDGLFPWDISLSKSINRFWGL